MKFRKVAEVTVSKDEANAIDKIMRDFFDNFGDDTDVDQIGIFLSAIYFREGNSTIVGDAVDVTDVTFLYER